MDQLVCGKSPLAGLADCGKELMPDGGGGGGRSWGASAAEQGAVWHGCIAWQSGIAGQSLVEESAAFPVNQDWRDVQLLFCDHPQIGQS